MYMYVSIRDLAGAVQSADDRVLGVVAATVLGRLPSLSPRACAYTRTHTVVEPLCAHSHTILQPLRAHTRHMHAVLQPQRAVVHASLQPVRAHTQTCG